MRNKITLAILALIISGCSMRTEAPEVTGDYLNGYDRYDVIIDSCQYIVCGNGYSQMMW